MPGTAMLTLVGILLTTVGSIIVSLLNRGKLTNLHLMLNSRLDKALASEREAGKAEGILEGIRLEKAKQASAKRRKDR